LLERLVLGALHHHARGGEILKVVDDHVGQALARRRDRDARGIGQIISAETRPVAWVQGTISVAPRNASRGSMPVSIRSSSG
jgi:hypothetical protein